MRDENDSKSAFGRDSFPATHWSAILTARDPVSPSAAAALDKLCASYWYPLYAYLRRWGHAPEEAKDLTQGFFANLLERNLVAAADRDKGRFRSFLLICLKRFAYDEHDKAMALKRGRGQSLLSLDDQDAEDHYRLEPVDEMTPEKLFERRWAMQVLEQVMERLRAEYLADGKQTQFDHLKDSLFGKDERVCFGDIAQKLGQNESTVRIWLFRMRNRYRDILREVVAQTVANEAEIDDELRHLVAAIN